MDGVFARRLGGVFFGQVRMSVRCCLGLQDDAYYIGKTNMFVRDVIDGF